MKKKIIIGLLLILMLAFTAVFAFKENPIATTCEEFIEFINGEIKDKTLSGFWEVTVHTEDTVVIQFTKKAVLSGYASTIFSELDFSEDEKLLAVESTYGSLLTDNSASFFIDFETGQDFTFPVTGNELSSLGWVNFNPNPNITCSELICSLYLGKLYQNSNSQGIFLNDVEKPTLCIDMQMSHPHNTTNSFELVAPNFTVCGGINQHSTIQDILKIVGKTPTSIEFNMNRSSLGVGSWNTFYSIHMGNFVGTPTIILTYPVYKNGEFQNGFVDFWIDAQNNNLLRVAMRIAYN